MDHILWGALWRWSKRRHPSKGKRWIKKRYFRREGARDWVFATGEQRLLTYSGFGFREHIKIKSDANPYDPEWDAYFDGLLSRQMAQTLIGQRKLLWLWREQKGQCPVCKQRITKQTKWHLHHKVWRCDGGSDKLTNLQLLHPACHRQHHARLSSGKAWSGVSTTGDKEIVF
jgi:RNA-directed DNA polymerase